MLNQVYFHFHPSLSKRSGRSKGFDVDVARGPNGKGAPTIASSRRSSRCREENRPQAQSVHKSTWTGSSRTHVLCCASQGIKYIGRSEVVGFGRQEVNAQTTPFLLYKRRGARRERGSRVERTKCCRTESGRFSLSFSIAPQLSFVQVSGRLALL